MRWLSPSRPKLAQSLGERVGAAKLDVAIRAEHQEPGASKLARKELEEQQRWLVAPVQVVEDEDHRLLAGGVLEERGDAVEETETRLLRLQGRRHRQAGQALLHFGDHLRDVRGAGPHLGHELLRLPLVDVGADRLHPRPVGGRAFALVAAAPDHLGVAEAGVGGELFRGARLADAGLADKHHQPPATGQGVFEACAQLVHLLVAAHEDAAGQSVEGVGVGLGGSGAVLDAELTMAWNASGMEAALSGRSSGSLARERMMSASSARGTSGLCQEGATGAVLMCCEMIATGSSPRNGGRPVTIS